MPITLDGSTGATVPAVSDSGNLTFTGTGNRITGDLGNATNASRVAFQNSTVNGGTRVSAIPNGTASSSGFEAYSGPSTDPNNASIAVMAAQGTTDVRFSSTISGTGTYLPMTFYTNGSEQMRISTAGIVTGTAGNMMLVQGTAQASTSGTAISFTGIPSWVKRVTMNFNGVSTSGTSGLMVQLGSSAGYATGTYTGSATNGAGSVATTAFTTGHGLNGGPLAANAYYGSAVFNNVSGNIWVGSSTLGATGTPQFAVGGSAITLAATFDRIQITTVGGTDTFDGGTINIQYE